MDIKDVLKILGFTKLVKSGNYYKTNAFYREGNNPTALSVNAKTGYFVDWVSGERGSINKLTQLALGLKNSSEAKSWLLNHEFDYSVESEEKPLITSQRVYPKSLLDKLVKIHTYWENRNIPSDVTKKFEGGVCISGLMSGRYVFPIEDDKNRIVGFAGRDITNKNDRKWLLIGDKQKWAYPVKNHKNIQESKTAILIESIGDLLSLERAKINNALVLFGVNLSDTIVSTLIRLNPSKIIIATNNDSKKNNAGNIAAEKIKERLSRFFDSQNVQIHLPKTKNDFGEMDDNEIIEWKSALEF